VIESPSCLRSRAVADIVDAELYVRQVLVHEIGLAGQSAIASASAALRGDTLAHQVATSYAVAAGFGGLEAAQGPLEPKDLDASLISPAARDVLIGARPG